MVNEPLIDDVDPVLMAIMANRLDGVVRQMTNTLLRAGRSAVIAVARDFSCSIVTADNKLLVTADAIPVHILGSHLQSRSMCELHPDIQEGDAFLHNDPYLGNTHPADHTILVPVFFEGEHLFTVCPKAHQADIGNSIPSTYNPWALDVYEEGALIFPCVRIQRNYQTVTDVVRMCRARIRVPDQWHGDFLALLGAARVGERRLKEFCQKYGKETVKRFIAYWMDYAELRMVQEIRRLPAGTVERSAAHDPFKPLLPEGIPINLRLSVDPIEARIAVDLTDNIDCLECGLNLSEACSLNSVMTGILNSLSPDLPRNAGAFRRISIKIRDGCVVGRPQFPHSCSVATTNVAERLVNLSQAAFAELGEGLGLAEGGCGMGGGLAVVSGDDPRRGSAPYINQLFCNVPSGPASPRTDGWLTYVSPVSGGAPYRDSVEIDEAKYPLHFRSMRIVPGTGGAGRFRGAPASEVIYGSAAGPMTVVITSDGQIFPPKGVRGGADGLPGSAFVISADGSEMKLANLVQLVLRPDERLRSVEASGGGYGDPLAREPERVRHDVLEGWETLERARDAYAVILTGSPDDNTLAVDVEATSERRDALRRSRDSAASQ